MSGPGPGVTIRRTAPTPLASAVPGRSIVTVTPGPQLIIPMWLVSVSHTISIGAATVVCEVAVHRPTLSIEHLTNLLVSLSKLLVVRPNSDLTSRARIRDAAMRLFADQGEQGDDHPCRGRTSRGGPGLVSHHFGSKQGLRDACDDYVSMYLWQIIEQGVDGQGVADPAYLASVYQGAAVATGSLRRRALVEDRRGPPRCSTTSSHSPRNTWRVTRQAVKRSQTRAPRRR